MKTIFHEIGCNVDVPQEFQCHLCEKAYPRADTLKRHILSFHEGKKMYKCEVLFKVIKCTFWKMFSFKRLVHLHRLDLQNISWKVEYAITIIIIVKFNDQGVQQELQGAHQGPHEDSRNGVRGKAIFLRPVWGEVTRLEKSLEISIDDAFNYS